MCQKDFSKIPRLSRYNRLNNAREDHGCLAMPGYQNMGIFRRTYPTALKWKKIQLRNGFLTMQQKKIPSLTWRYAIFKSNQNVCVFAAERSCAGISYGHIYIYIYICRIYNLEMKAVQVLQYDVKHTVEPPFIWS